jgi:trans-2,3-dihydro-3-hydroxyanthranilate isomerase
MQAVALELNLAETTFVLPATRSDCHARVRIFTPRQEMRFAGHPTLGTAFLLSERGVLPADGNWHQLEEQVGPVAVRIDLESPPLAWLRTPPISEGRRFAPDICARALGLGPNELLDIEPQLLSAGNPTIFVALRSPDAVDRAWIDLAGMRTLHGADEESCCVFVFARTAEGAYSRMFAAEYGINEDPATGSSTGPLAVFMMRNGLLARRDGTAFVSEQGTRMGRRSLLHVRVLGDDGAQGILVGGHVTLVASAHMHLSLEG